MSACCEVVATVSFFVFFGGTCEVRRSDGLGANGWGRVGAKMD